MKSRTIARLAAALAGATAGAVLLAVPAYADHWKGNDPAGDVAAKKCRPTCDYSPAPDQAGADMVKVNVAYRQKDIRIAVKLRAVDRSSSFAVTSLLAKTDREGRYFSAIAAFSPQRADKVMLKGPSGASLKCEGASTSIKGNKVLTLIPARCIKSPEWVRWSGYTRTIFPGDLDSDKRFSGWFDKFRTSSSTPLNKNTFEFSRRITHAG